MEDTAVDKLAVNRYFYGLLRRYLSVFVRSDNTAAEIRLKSCKANKIFDKSKEVILERGDSIGNNPVEFAELEQLSTLDPDFVVLNSAIHYERDILALLRNLHKNCSSKTRVVFLYYSSLWKPLLRLASFFKKRIKTPEQNWVDPKDIKNMLLMADFEPVFSDLKVIIPVYIPLISGFVNRYLAPLPGIRSLCMVSILIARPLNKRKKRALSVSVVVPARNEAGNIENIVKRIPRMGPEDEIIFVEGHSEDPTWDEISRVKEKYGKITNILCIKQEGSGKADAVRKGFECASKDIFMILDADLSVQPEALTDFYKAIYEDKAEFLSGSRLVYPHDGKAMRFFNMVGNKFFATVFSFLVGNRFKDTLCGTKVFTREDYKKIIMNRDFFGDFDPFGDFDLILGASRLCLKVGEIPVRYHERTYGKTNIKRWKDGIVLLRMSIFAGHKLKFI